MCQNQTQRRSYLMLVCRGIHFIAKWDVLHLRKLTRMDELRQARITQCFGLVWTLCNKHSPVTERDKKAPAAQGDSWQQTYKTGLTQFLLFPCAWIMENTLPHFLSAYWMVLPFFVRLKLPVGLKFRISEAILIIILGNVVSLITLHVLVFAVLSLQKKLTFTKTLYLFHCYSAREQ